MTGSTEVVNISAYDLAARNAPEAWRERDWGLMNIDPILKESGPPERLEVRRAAEAEARSLLKADPRTWSEEDAARFFDLLDQDFYDGGRKQTRFGLAFRGKNRKEMLSERAALLRSIHALFSEPEDRIEGAIDQALGISGAGRALVSTVLYLRDRGRYACWSPTLVSGVSQLVGSTVNSPRTGLGYLDYNSAAQQVIQQYSIPPEAFDAVAWQVAEEFGRQESVVTTVGKDESFLKPRAFELLAQLTEDPTKEFYDRHKDDLKSFVVSPVQDLVRAVGALLPVEIRAEYETEKHLFGSFLKNDFGKGGAWPFYWGAIYPKGGKKTTGAQLFVSAKAALLDVGFSIGEYADQARERFSRNCALHGDAVQDLIESSSLSTALSFGKEDESGGGGVPGLTIQAWIDEPAHPRAAISLPKAEVLEWSFEQLRDRVLEIFQMLHPLAVLATVDDPTEQLEDLGARITSKSTGARFSGYGCVRYGDRGGDAASLEALDSS